jgi:hypothetical protein
MAAWFQAEYIPPFEQAENEQAEWEQELEDM